MNPIRKFTLCIALFACLLHSVAVEALSLEHSFDGQTFKRVASLDIPEIGDQAPLTDYTEALAADASKLLTTAKADGLYYIRISGGVIASIPARCWAKAGSNAQLIINALDARAITGASLLAPCGATVAPLTDDSQLKLPTLDTAVIVRPVPAPTVTLPAAAAGAGAQTAAMQQASSAAKGQEEKKKGEPEKDERTWIQKNWLPLALVAFMMFNRMGQAGQENAGGAPPPGRALPAGASRPPAGR